MRHLKTKGNYEKRYIGTTDESLENAHEQEIRIELPQMPNGIYTSPMKRCIETMEKSYPETQGKTLPLIHVVQDLREMDFGEFENKTYEELKDDEHYRKFIDGVEEPRGGEPRKNFKKRSVDAFAQIIESYEKDEFINNEIELVIFCHGGTIMSILEAFDIEKGDFYDYQIPNGGGIICTLMSGRLHIEEKSTWN